MTTEVTFIIVFIWSTPTFRAIFGHQVFILPWEKIHVTDGIEWQWRSFKYHWRCKWWTRTESRLLNACGSPVVVRGQNENRAATRREEDVSESRSIVNRVGRNFNFLFILKCMLLFACLFPFQFLTKTNKTELSQAWLCKTTRKMGLTSLHNFYGSWHFYICGSLLGHSTFFVMSLVFYEVTSCCYKEEF